MENSHPTPDKRVWISVATPPKHSHKVYLGWFTTPVIAGKRPEYEQISRWLRDHWEGNWTPTHWSAT